MLSTGDVIKVVVAFTMPDSVVAQLVTHYLVGAGSDILESDALDDIDVALGFAWASIEARVHDGVLGDTIKLSVWDFTLNQFDEKASKSTSLFDGTSTDQMLPHGAAAVLRLFTAVGRRQGRKFIPGLAEAEQGDGTWGALTVTDLAICAARWDNVVTVDSTPVSAGVFNIITELFEIFSGTVAANTIVGYQRRRKAGVGI